MFEIQRRWKGVTDKEMWAERGASFVAKVKATKAVWFPPEPVETGRKAGAAAKKTAKKTTSKTAKKTANGAGTAKKKTVGAAKKAPRSAKKSTSSAGS